jgi:hypothetical protein
MTLRVADIISTIESNGNLGAMRFEPGVYAKIGDKAYAYALSHASSLNKCNLNTAEMICCTSWGKFQMMGFNLYGTQFGYPNSIAEYLASEEQQEAMFAKYVCAKGIEYSINDLATVPQYREAFALRYNGALSYADKILAQLRQRGLA